MIKTFRRILNSAGKYKGRLKVAFVVSVIHSFFNFFLFYAVFYLLQNLENMTPQVALNCFLIMLASVVGKMITQYQLQDKQSGTGYKIAAQKRLEIGNLLKRVPLGYFSEKNLGDITAAVTTTMGDYEMLSMMVMDKIVNGIVIGTMATIFMLLTDWRAGLITLAAVLLTSLINRYMMKRSAILGAERQKAQADMVTDVLEYVQGMGVIKTYSLENAARKVDGAFEQSRRANMDAEIGLVPPMIAHQTIFKLASVGILALAPYLLFNGTIDLSSCIMLIFSSFVIFAALELMGSMAAMMRIAEASLKRIEKVEHAPLLDETSKEMDLKRSDIEMRHVSFAYDNRTVIDDVSFIIPERTTTAIVGPSGSGKTTLCNLIARFWDVQKGEVLVGGVNVRDITSESLLKNMSMVFQNVYLFNDTVANNIRFGKAEASMEEVIQVAKKARCHEFIMELPKGYDTVLNEGGSSLSGGEKQRISIARAMLKDAPIVILDEATASVDPENEYYILQALEQLTKNKTVITIAHRLNTVRGADQILVLEEGRIVQRGTHKELVKEKGIYSNFIEIREKSVGWTIA